MRRSKRMKVKQQEASGLKLKKGSMLSSGVAPVKWSFGPDPSMEDLIALCPKEIWCLILESLEDSKDMLNTFKAYPEMEGLMRHKRHVWLFDQVLPNIVEWLDEKDLLTCRLVNKHWSKTVNNFLSNHPSLRAYHHDSQVTGQVWGLANYSKSFHGPNYRHPDFQFSRRYFQTSFVFGRSEAILRFSSDMKTHSLEKNPILGRSVKFYPNDDVNNNANELQVKEFWETGLTFLHNWGEHIWFVSLWGCKDQNGRDFFQTLQRTLSLLPNLKSLEVNSRSRWISRRNFASFRPNMLPILPQLETLKLDFWFRTLSDLLINRYGSQVRRLVISPGWDWEWKEQAYSNLFPNLTELEISHTSYVKGLSWNGRINQVLLSLNAPQLHWLQVEFPQTGRFLLTTEEVCGWLRRFPRLNHFRLADCSGASPAMILRAEVPVQHLKSLSVHDSAVSSKFLLSFPSLECLEIRTDCGHSHSAHRSRNPVRFFQEYIQNGSLANVWVLLSKLKTLVLVHDCRDIKDRFCRAKFENYLRGLVYENGSTEGETGTEEDESTDEDI